MPILDPSARGPRRVLWLSKGLGPGGSENLLVALAQAHDRALVAPEVAYVVPWKDALVPALRDSGVVVHPLGGRGWVPRLAALLHRGRFDVVHGHASLMSAAARLMSPWGVRAPRPVLVSTEHNAWRRRRWGTRLANAATISLDAAVLAVSDEVQASIWWPSVRRRCEVLVHGVDLAATSALKAERGSVRRELGIADHEVVVATVANLRPQKAWPDLLHAARAVIDGWPDLAVRFVGVGQGPQDAEIRALHAQLGLGKRFLVLGYRPDAVRVLAGSDVFTMASRWEGYPVALMEALALGLPVAATAVGGLADAVRPGVEGKLVPPGQPAQLAAAIAELVADPQARACYAAAAQARSALFDIRRAARRLEALYEELASPDRRHALRR